MYIASDSFLDKYWDKVEQRNKQYCIFNVTNENKLETEKMADNLLQLIYKVANNFLSIHSLDAAYKIWNIFLLN